MLSFDTSVCGWIVAQISLFTLTELLSLSPHLYVLSLACDSPYFVLAGSEDFIYDGEWQFGHRTGKGHAIWAGRQESYTGEWLRGDFHGRGIDREG